jgi:molybdopterin converting factor small subunit
MIPGLLRSYTGGAARVGVAIDAGATLDAALRALDARYRGLRFRIVDEQGAIRPHIRIFVDGAQARALDIPIRAGAELMIVGALSGG